MSKQYEGNGADALADAIARYTKQGYRQMQGEPHQYGKMVNHGTELGPCVAIWMRDEDGRVYSEEY